LAVTFTDTFICEPALNASVAVRFLRRFFSAAPLADSA
jgi:hypothetical protein